MSFRTRVCPQCLRAIAPKQSLSLRPYATAAAITPAPSIEQMTTSIPPVVRYPATQPPSYKPPEFRRSQLLRQYASLIQTTPMMIFFQHNNLKATEWMGIRRELASALRKVDETRTAAGLNYSDIADNIRIQIIQTGVFGAALRIVEYYHPESQPTTSPSNPKIHSSNEFPSQDLTMTHILSKQAHDAVADKKKLHELEPLLTGPLAILTFPAVSTEHLKAAISVLSPKGPVFPAPRRKVAPGYYEPGVQIGIKKLMLLGARVEEKVFDLDGTRWVGSIEGGLDGLRGQLVAMLQSCGAGITNTLEAAGKSLYFTMESRKTVMEEEAGQHSEAGAKE
jgi:large subunit ribosomal protein L10